MPSTRRLLADDEEILADLRPHPVFVGAPAALLVAAAAGAVAIAVELPGAPVDVGWVLVAMVGVPALWLAVRVVRWRSVHLLVTTTRLVYRRGVLGRDVIQLRLQRVAEVHCRQTLFDRLVGSGRLVVEVVDDVPLAIDDVRRPRRVQRLVGGQLDRMDTDPYVGDRLGATRELLYAATPPMVPPESEWPPPPPLQARHEAWSETPPHGVAAADVTATLAAPLPTAPPPADDRTEEPVRAHHSVPARLIALDDLWRRGIVTDAEYAAKKAELLDRL